MTREIIVLDCQARPTTAVIRLLFLSDTILEYNAHEFYPDDWDSCLQLYRHQYWKRIWTLQEIIRVRDVRLVCGLNFLHW